MGFGEYVKNAQPVLYRMFSNALHEGRLGHAYLLLGEPGVPLKQTAIYLAKSMLCLHPDPLADECCSRCLRIANNDYPDFKLLEGESESVKKDSVTSIEDDFSKTPLERDGKMVYVITQIENMTPDAANSILKFLEEPSEDTYAILTANNESKVLPTIISRCEVFRLRLLPLEQVREELRKKAASMPSSGDDSPIIGEEDIELLPCLYNDASVCLQTAANPDYIAAKEALKQLLDAYGQGKDYARFVMEKDVTAAVGKKPALRMFFDLLCLVLQDSIDGGKKLPSFAIMASGLSKSVTNLQDKLLQALTLRQKIETNVNPGLLLTHLSSKLGED